MGLDQYVYSSTRSIPRTGNIEELFPQYSPEYWLDDNTPDDMVDVLIEQMDAWSRSAGRNGLLRREFYWRKHEALQVWAQQLWLNKGGVCTDADEGNDYFNYPDFVKLDLRDIDELLRLSLDLAEDDTDIAVDFSSDWWNAATVAFCSAANAWIKDYGLELIYSPSW